MRRGLVLAFPPRRRFTPDDCESLQRFAAAFPEVQIDIVIGRDRREIAIVAFNGRQLWISRNGRDFHIGNAAGGQHHAVGTLMGDILSAFQAGLLDSEALDWGVVSKVIA